VAGNTVIGAGMLTETSRPVVSGQCVQAIHKATMPLTDSDVTWGGRNQGTRIKIVVFAVL